LLLAAFFDGLLSAGFVNQFARIPMRVLFEPFDRGYELTPHDRSRVNLGPIKNQSAGLDSGIITSIELSAARRQHLVA
jgi:hypothetical protein